MRSFYETWIGIEHNSPIGIGELQSDLLVVTAKLQQDTEMCESYRNVARPYSHALPVTYFFCFCRFSDYETYKVYRVHHHATMTKERLIKTGYPFTPSADKYFCYVFDEEVSIGLIDIKSFLAKHKFPSTPLFVTGEKMMKYRK